jgi:hypothetical protein
VISARRCVPRAAAATRGILELSYAQAKKIGAVGIAERAAENCAAGVRPRRSPPPACRTDTLGRRVAEPAAAGR